MAGAAAYNKVGSASGGAASPGFQSKYTAEASQLLGTDQLNGWMLDFINGVDDCAQVVSTNSTQAIVGDDTDAVNSIGGVLRMGTGTDNAARDNLVLPHVSGSFAPMCGFNTPTIKFYRAFRFRMNTAPDANTNCWIGSLGWRAGVIGANSATRFSLQVKSTSPVYITSTIDPRDNLYHVGATYWDGVNAWLRFDAEPWQPLGTLAQFPISNAVESYWRINNGKLGGATNHLIDVDWGLWLVSPT